MSHFFHFFVPVAFQNINFADYSLDTREYKTKYPPKVQVPITTIIFLYGRQKRCHLFCPAHILLINICLTQTTSLVSYYSPNTVVAIYFSHIFLSADFQIGWQVTNKNWSQFLQDFSTDANQPLWASNSGISNIVVYTFAWMNKPYYSTFIIIYDFDFYKGHLFNAS